MQNNLKKTYKTLGVLAGAQVYYNTILGNFIGPVLYGIRSAASDYGCNLLVAAGMDDYTVLSHSAWPEPAADADFIPVGPWNTDGLIVVNPLLSESKSAYIQNVRRAGLPVVYVSTGEDGPTVSVDNHLGIQRALTHLVEHGHRSIAFIAGYPQDVTGDSVARLRAYQVVIQEMGLVSDPRLIAYSYHSIKGGKAAMQQLMATGVKFTAVLSSNDEAAIGAMEAIKSAGLRIPEDIAIVGFDDSLEALTQTPSLTTLHYSPSEMGYTALELLLEYVVGRKPINESVSIPVRLVSRRSCGCQIAGAPDFRDDTPAVMSFDRAGAMAHLVKAMTENAMAEAQCLSLVEVHALCSRLVEALISGLKSDQPEAFYRAMDDARFRAEAVNEDASIWHAALTALENRMEMLLTIGCSMMKLQEAEKMLRHVRFTVNQSVRRQSRRYMVRQRWHTDWVGRLNASLLAALDRTQIFQILAESFPTVGVDHAGVAFFKPDEADPVMWTELHTICPPQDEPVIHFPSRQFPPPGIYPEPFSLILLPLAKQQDESAGFVVFDTSNLELYATVVWQLRTFFKVTALYQEATEGRRLAEEAARSKNRFLAMVSHELRTPLSLIMGLSELLVRDSTDSSMSQVDLDSIRSNARQLDGLMRDVLDLAQAEAGEWKLQREVLDFAEVLQPVVIVGEQLAKKKGLAWQVDIPNNLPQVWGDCIRLRQITLNLINNAVKFTEIGTVSLQVRTSKSEIIVSVDDTGPGIPVEEQEAVFTEFRQCGRTAAQRSDGLGLGLAICKRLVELHDGKIGVRSSGKDGDGTTIYFTIPHLEAPAPALANLGELEPTSTSLKAPTQPGSKGVLSVRLVHVGSGQTPGPEPENLPIWKLPPLPIRTGEAVLSETLVSMPVWAPSHDISYLHKPTGLAELAQAVEQSWDRKPHRQGERILIVDDDPGILETFARMLQDWSAKVEVLTARNGVEGLELIRSSQPDLVLLDLSMPELDGFEVLKIMHSDAGTRDIPVIILSGQELTQETIQRLSTGVNTILHKDLFSEAEVSSHVDAVLHGEKEVAATAQYLARKAMVYLHEQYVESISLEQVAAHFGVCKEYLARCFRDETGVTLVTYLNRYRIKQAKALLRQGEKRIVDVAMQVGFSNSAYFSRVFKQETGKSPQAYRQRH